MKPTIAATALALFLPVVAALPAYAQGGCCVQPDNGNGTVDLMTPCPYFGPMVIVDGLPATASIDIDASLGTYFNDTESSGGVLGGTIVTFVAILQLEMSGNGSLQGFHRLLAVPVDGEIHFGPRTPGDAVQDFPGDVRILTGELFGDPDFELLRVRAGTEFGLPSPGQTTLTRLGPPGDPFTVDSFFDIAYEIEFQGAPGSILEGFAGTTPDTKRFDLCPISTSVPEPYRCCTTWSDVKRIFR